MKNKHYNAFIGTYLILNGMAVGNLISLIRQMNTTGTNNTTIGATVLTAGAAIYTAKRAIEVYRDQQNHNQK